MERQFQYSTCVYLRRYEGRRWRKSDFGVATATCLSPQFDTLRPCEPKLMRWSYVLHAIHTKRTSVVKQERVYRKSGGSTSGGSYAFCRTACLCGHLAGDIDVGVMACPPQKLITIYLLAASSMCIWQELLLSGGVAVNLPLSRRCDKASKSVNSVDRMQHITSLFPQRG